MKLIFLIGLILHFGTLQAQKPANYRFGIDVSGLSIMNYGLMGLENVPSPIYPDYYKVYNTESYNLNYQKFSFSKGLNFGFSVNIINNYKYSLRAGINVFYEKYNERLTYTLIDVGDDSLVDYGIYTPPFSSEDIPLGYSETVTFSDRNRKSGGIIFDGMLFRKFNDNWLIGGGMFYIYRLRHEWYDTENTNSYQPWVLPRALNSYSTKQLGVSVEIQKSINRFNVFINLSQTIITTKKEENKGGDEFKGMQPMVPLSQNLDFRFPLIIKFGVAVEFGKIKEFITIGMPDF